MATVYMTANSQSNIQNGSPIYSYSETPQAGQIGNTIMLPDGSGKVKDFSIALIVVSGSGLVQFSLSDRDIIKAGGGNWFNWDAGTVTATDTDLLGPVSAVRAVNNSGVIAIEVQAV